MNRQYIMLIVMVVAIFGLFLLWLVNTNNDSEFSSDVQDRRDDAFEGRAK